MDTGTVVLICLTLWILSLIILGKISNYFIKKRAEKMKMLCKYLNRELNSTFSPSFKNVDNILKSMKPKDIADLPVFYLEITGCYILDDFHKCFAGKELEYFTDELERRAQK